MRYQKVYFIHAQEVRRVKIGVAHNVSKRLGAIQSSSPCKLQIVGILDGGKELEKILHLRFAEYRSHGEWFSDAILDQIDGFVAEFERVKQVYGY